MFLQAPYFLFPFDVWLSAFCTATGVYIFLRGFRVLQRKRLIQNTPASKIRSAAMGLVEVAGVAVGPRAITSPIGGIPCYYYRTIAWQLKQSSRKTDWEKVADENLHVPFYLDDRTGMVLVNPQGAELELHRDFRQEFKPSPLSGNLSLPANVAGFAGRHGFSTNKKLKIEEYSIQPKTALFVLGTLALNPNADLTTPLRPKISDSLLDSAAVVKMSDATLPLPEGAPAPDSGPEVIRLRDAPRSTSAETMTQQEKVAAALTRAGIANPSAWAAAETIYPGVTGNAKAVSPGSAAAVAPALDMKFDLRPKTVLLKGSKDPVFFISWRSQRNIVRSLSWQASLMIWGGPALILLSLYILLTHLGLR